MNKFDLISKSLSRLSFLKKNTTNYNYDEINYKDINITPLIELYKSINENLTLIDDLYNIEKIEEQILLFRQNNPTCKLIVIIDYLQYIRVSHNSSDKQNIDIIVKKLKALSKSAEASIIAISSLNRANYSNSIDMESFKESGGIEYTSDILIGLEFANNMNDRSQQLRQNPRNISLKIIKNRNGALGKVDYKFYTEYHTFIEI